MEGANAMSSTVQEQSTERSVLSPEQREFFDVNGYLVVEDAHRRIRWRNWMRPSMNFSSAKSKRGDKRWRVR